MITALCVWCSLFTVGVAEGPTPAPQPNAAEAAIAHWCPKVEGDAKGSYLNAYELRNALTPESSIKHLTEVVLPAIDAALEKVGHLPDCSPMYALRGAIYHEIAMRHATSEEWVGRAIIKYDKMVNYREVRDSLERARQDLKLAQRIEQSSPDEAISRRLVNVESAFRRVNNYIAQRRKEDDNERIEKLELNARIWGGIAVVGGGMAGAVGVAFLGQGLVVEDLDCKSGRCVRIYRRESLVGGAAGSLAGGALLGIGLHQLVRSRRLSKPDGPFPERPVGVILMLTSLVPLAIGGALALSGDNQWDRAEVADSEAWQGAFKRMNRGWAVLGLVAPILGSGIGLRIPVKRAGPPVSLSLVPSVTSATLTLQF